MNVQYPIPTVKAGRRNVIPARRGTLDQRFHHIPFPLPDENLALKGLLADQQVLLFDEAQYAFLRFQRGFFGEYARSPNHDQSRHEGAASNEQQSWQYCSKRDTFPPPSHILPIASLNLCEAFFLAYACGALDIWDYATNQKILRQNLMSVFSALDPLFPYFAAAYFHFRRKLYVVKSGLRFGCDFVLYEYGPSRTHSLYAVYIVIPALRDPGLSVLDTMQRAANAVKKDVLMVQVLKSSSVSPQMLELDYMKDFQITEIIIRRRETILNPKENGRHDMAGKKDMNRSKAETDRVSSSSGHVSYLIVEQKMRISKLSRHMYGLVEGAEETFANNSHNLWGKRNFGMWMIGSVPGLQTFL